MGNAQEDDGQSGERRRWAVGGGDIGLGERRRRTTSPSIMLCSHPDVSHKDI